MLSLVCDLCKKDVVIMKLLCCNGEYHEDCLNRCKEQGVKKCSYCRCPMQEGGRRNGGEDYWYLSIQEELGKLMSLLLKILFTCDEAIKSLSVGLEAYLMLQGWKNREEHVRNLCKY